MRLLIVYVNSFGNAGAVAHSFAERLELAGHHCEVENLSDLLMEDLVAEVRPVIFCVSTLRNGDPPTDALEFWNGLLRLRRGTLFTLCYAVYALGSRSCEGFCGFGKKLDECLAARGGARMLDLVKHDSAYHANLQRFTVQVIHVLRRLSVADLSHFLV